MRTRLPKHSEALRSTGPATSQSGLGGSVLEIAGRRAETSELVWLELLRAVDRPDRLEFALPSGSATFSGQSAWLTRGAFVTLVRGGDGGAVAEGGLGIIEGSGVFEGRVDAVTLRSDTLFGQHIVVSAVAVYHFLRTSSERVYHQVTDADIAERVARELELVAVVEASSRLYDRVTRRGDPLRFLRQRAQSANRHLAVTGGRLYFRKTIPAMSRDALRAKTPELVSFEWMERGSAGHQGGKCVVCGNRPWQPLTVLTLTDFGPAVDGPYRLLRSRQRVDPEGCTTTAWFLDEGLSYTDWLGRKPA